MSRNSSFVRKYRYARATPLFTSVRFVVNGPGEAREADLGLAAGKGKGHLFIKGEVVRVVPEAEMVDALIAEAKLIGEQGTEARLAAADVSAADLAEETAVELRTLQGDANKNEERMAAVAEVAAGLDRG